jgi:hypothetical protein
MLRCLLIAGLLAGGCKGKAKPASSAVGSAAGYEPKSPPSRESKIAAKLRATLFAKVGKLIADANGDCTKLGSALEALRDEVTAAHDAKYELLDADRVTDAKLEADTIKPLLVTQCTDPAKIDAFMSALSGGEARGSASDAHR